MIADIPLLYTEISSGTPIEYKKWKEFRMQKLKEIGQKLIKLEQNLVKITFEQWESYIKKQSVKESQRSQMIVLTSISILHFFKRDLHTTRHFHDQIMALLQSTRVDVFQAAAEVLHWIAEESPDGSSLFTQPVVNALGWLKSKKQTHIRSALYIFKKAKDFPEVNLAHQLISSLDQLYNIACNEDHILRLNAVSIIRYVFNAINYSTNKILIKNYFHSCQVALNGKHSPSTHGPLLILQILFDLQPSLFDDIKGKLITTLLEISRNEYAPMSIDAMKFCMSIEQKGDGIFSQSILQEFLDSLLNRCSKAKEKKEYYSILEEAIKMFEERLNISQIVEFIEDVLFDATDEEMKCSFSALAVILEVFPDTKFDHFIFEREVLCDEGIRCLSLMPYVNKDVMQFLIGYVHDGLHENAAKNVIIQSLKLARIFKEEAFQSSEELYNAIIVLAKDEDEEVQFEVAKTMELVENEDSANWLLKTALFDKFDKVRYEALVLMKPSVALSTNKLLPLVLSDQDVEMRRAGIKLISQMIQYNPFGLESSVLSLIEDLFAAVTSYDNVKLSSDSASLLPLIVKTMRSTIKSFEHSFIIGCIAGIYPDLKPIETSECSFSEDLKRLQIDSKKIPIRDEFSYISTVSKKGRKKNDLFSILYRELIDKRDGFLLDTLALFPEQITPFIDIVLMVFYRIFTKRDNKKLLEKAAVSLSIIARGIGDGLNLRLYCPQFIPALTRILTTTTSKGLAIKILGLLGTAVDTFGDLLKQKGEAELELAVDVVDPSYYTDFTLTHLSRYFNQPNEELFDSVTRIIESAPDDTAKFIEKVIKMFIRTLNVAKPKQRAVLYSQLEQITASCPNETFSLLPELTDCLFQHVSDTGCMLLCSCLSFTFMSSFIPYSRLLYIAGIGCLEKEENFAETIKFLTFSICFQNQPVTLLLGALAKLSMQSVRKYATKIAKNLCYIVQTVDVSLHQARIARIIRVLFEIIPDNDILKNLAFSLVIVCRMSESVIRCFIPPQIDITEVMDALKSGNYSLRNLDFIKILEINFMPTHYDIPPKNSPIGHFEQLTVPSELGAKQWLESINQFVISCSPSDVIRCCSSFVENQKKFRNNLFPAAFLSCWEVLPPENKRKFCNIISKMIQQHSKIDQRILIIAEIADRALLPFDISYIELSRVCESKHLALYFLQKEHIRDPSNIQVVEMLLAINNSMGRTTSAQGLLAQVNVKKDKVLSARWNEFLFDWKGAIDMYEKTPATLSNRIRCHAHLHQCKEIISLEKEFWSMSKSEQIFNARHFAWAFYNANDWSKAMKFIPYFEHNSSLPDIFLLSIIHLRQNKLDEAEQCVKRAFDLIASDRTMYSGGDIDKASYNLSLAQLLVEIDAAINFKRSKADISPDIWSKYVKSFKRNGETWIKLIEIRSLISPPDENYDAYVKVLSVLRNECKWEIADRLIQGMKDKELPVEIMLAQAKIEWARNQHERAIDILNKVREREMSTYVGAKVARTLANYISQAESDLHRVSDLYAEAQMLRADDSRNWIGWAYTNHAIAQLEDSDERAIDAVFGFLQAAKLKRKASLEYLVLLFAILFKIKDSSLISTKLTDELLNLTPDMIEQVIPQIAVQISHPDTTIRNIVHKILTKFGNVHFQLIMFPLGMYKTCNEPEKVSAASEILLKLQKKHRVEAEDSQIFVKGMLDAALTPFERCIALLDDAAFAKRAGDINKMRNILYSMFVSVLNNNKRSNLEKRFYKMYETQLKDALRLFNDNTQESNAMMWEVLRDLYMKLNEKVSKLEIILLPRVNNEVYVKRNFSISIPGTYAVNHKSPKIQLIEPGLQVLNTQQHPRILYIVSDTHQRVKFLLKGAEDLRLDQRIMQFFDLVNSLLNNSQTVNTFSTGIVRYAIIPLSSTTGLIRWVENADTLHQMICDMRDVQNRSQILEFEVVEEETNCPFRQLTYPQRLEVFDEIVKKCPADEVRNFLWYRSPNAAAWVETQDNFCITTALMSMIGYIIGLGDRHPSNIMVQRDTGRVIHIDFGDTFEKTILRQSYPEKVPFRLTRMIVHALDGGYVEGMFTQLCNSTMEVLRQNKSSIVALLEIFMHEPIEDNSTIQAGHQSPKAIIERVASKLNGTDMMDEFGRQLCVSEQVEILIRDATDPTLYIAHYPGWCPYW